MASAAISGVIMLAQPGQHAAFQSLAVHGAGVVAAVAKPMVGAGVTVRIGSAVRP
jgi:drug/metabolite transporter (DMT)-like permease